MLRNALDPNRKCRMTGPNQAKTGTWWYTLRDAETGLHVNTRLGFKTFDEAVRHAYAYHRVEGE